MKLQLRIWQLVTSRGFEYCLFTLIIINTVALAMKVFAFRGVRLVSCVAQLAEPRSLAGELTLSCGRPAADG